ncbi:nacht domain protein [Colletotrichum kahawae]|uniref:Nacht domain protein n=1 Tax=Colletotrichum kahawae TaxID=34407 RepID=A0AAE0D592_COLKA|nr:nacht domain protein [Colletotrichum kahawae]
MAPDRHTLPLRNGEVSLASPSNALVATCSDRPTTLENALKTFQDVLDVDERKRLREEMSVSCDASQVIAFTARLDIVDPNRRGRSIATRLHSILETVQRFSEVVGIYVSSHPEIAALVWGSVRLAFTVLANFNSFFQTFSDLLNGFDTLTPQFKEYQVLFPESLALRNAVYDFHSAIISCCTQVVSSTRRTWSQQAWASLTSSFESEIRPRVNEIREKAKVVKGEAALAKAQDDSQRKWNSLLLRLSSYDHGAEFNYARGKIHRGTAEWIFNTSEFLDWYENTDSSVLNITGIIGSGKTVLTANVVSHLLQNLPPNCSVAYLFVRFDDGNSRLTDTILRSLIFQGLAGHEVQDSLMELLEKSVSSNFERDLLLSLLDHSISLLEKTFLIVDGLDQCSPDEQHALLQSFSRLIQTPHNKESVKILISSRESMSKEVDGALAPTKHLRIGLADTNADLARYAEEVLLEKRRQKHLRVRDGTIMDEIVDKLRIGGEGMFLWVFLTIEDICSCPTDGDIRQTLETLPRKLSDTFNRALGRILSSQPSSIVDIVQNTFSWVATVRRPVTQWELGEALGVRILQKSSIKGQIINGTERIPSWCENLIQIEAGDETVRFFHHSIKTHLLDTALTTAELGAFHIDLKYWDHKVGEICLTYLNFSDFEKALTLFSSDTNGIPVRQIAMSREGRSIPGAVENQAVLDTLPHTLPHSGKQAAARFLRRFQKQTELRATSLSEDTQDLSEFFSDYPFLPYAIKFWFSHTFRFNQSTTQTWSLWEDQVTRSILEDNQFWATFGQQPPGFETFDLESWLVGDKSLYAGTLRLSVSEMKELINHEVIALHKAIIFADFNAHRALLTHALMTLKDRRFHLLPDILEHLLPTRRVLQSPLKRKGYMRDEDSHDGLISLVTEYIALGGPTWPGTQFRMFADPCYATCEETTLHKEMIRIIFDSGYHEDAWFQLLARIAVSKLSEESMDAIETWIDSDKQCIHEFKTPDNRDIIDVILETGGLTSFTSAHWAIDLHQRCASGHRFNSDYWCRKLQLALVNNSTIGVKFYLQELKAAIALEKGYSGVNYGLLWALDAHDSLIFEFRSQIISLAIPRVVAQEQEKQRAYLEFPHIIYSGNWDVAVAFARHGLKFADSAPAASEMRSWLRVLDDILRCVYRSEAQCCTRRWPWGLKARTMLVLCFEHHSKAKRKWSRPYDPGDYINDGGIESLKELLKRW